MLIYNQNKLEKLQELAIQGANIEIPKKIPRLLSIAVESIYLNEKCKFHIAAVGLTKDKSVIIGLPRFKTHPQQKERYEDWCTTIHAEHDLILKARNKTLTDVVVVRAHGKYNVLVLSKPCIYCRELLEEFQPQARVYYVNDNGSLRKLKGEERE